MERTNVVSLDSGLRLARGNTERSTPYIERRQKLTDLSAKRLERLEEALFTCRPGLTACDGIELPKPYCCFAADDGRIWWYFSSRQRRFILLDFQLFTPAPGGLPLPIETKSYCCDGRSLAYARDLDRVAAHHAQAAEAFSLVLGPTEAGAVAARYASLMRRLIESERRTARIEQLVRLGRQFFGSPAFNEMWLQRMDSQPLGLPHWSLLSATVSDPTQLSNPYARAILRGEAFSRLAGTETRHRRHRPTRKGLLADSLGLIDLLCSQQDRTRRNIAFAHFKITGAVAGRLYEDDALVSIARTELVEQLAIHVSTSAASIFRSQYHSADGGRTRQVMKKYALLTDFAVLSEQLFFLGQPTMSADRIWTDYKDELVPKHCSVGDLRRMETLDTSIRIIVMSMASDVKEPPIDQRGYFSSLRKRLNEVTEALLRPV